MTPMLIPGSPRALPTLGIIELSSIAKGLIVCDMMVKKARVDVLHARPVGCGKYLLLVTGPEADLEESVREGCQVGEAFLMDWSLIPNLHPEVEAALQRKGGQPLPVDAVGILESRSLSALIRASDGAVKTAGVRILELTFNLDLGGKGYVTFTGPLPEVEAALDHAGTELQQGQALVHQEILARPHAVVGQLVQGGLERACF